MLEQGRQRLLNCAGAPQLVPAPIDFAVLPFAWLTHQRLHNCALWARKGVPQRGVVRVLSLDEMPQCCFHTRRGSKRAGAVGDLPGEVTQLLGVVGVSGSDLQDTINRR